MRPLVIRYRKLGDTLMVTPILRALAEGGADGVYTVGERAFERVLTRHPAVRGNESVQRGNPSRTDLFLACLRARRFRCDTALVMRWDRRTALASRLTGCKVRVGALRGEPRGSSLTRNVYDPDLWADGHQVEKYYAIAEGAVGPLPRLPTSYLPAEGTLPCRGGLPERFVAVHVGNGGSNLGWPDPSYAATVQGLRAMGLAVVASGAAADAPLYHQARAAADLDLAGGTDLDALASLFAAAEFVVGVDGGAMRLAAAVGTPIVSMSIGFRWSARQSAPWLAPGLVVEAPRHCAECRPHYCDLRGRTCVESLTPDRVLSAADELRRATQAGR